jgi:hypothetical protein
MSTRRVASSGLAVIVMLTTAVASAAPGPESPPAAPARTGWYGWKFLAADLGVIVTAAVITAGSGGDAAPVGGVLVVGGLLLSGPVVHGSHGRWDLGGRSLVLRALLPVLGGGAGLLVGDRFYHDPEQEGWDVLYAGFLGFTAGFVTAEVIDMASGWEDLRVAPVVAPTPGGATAGLAVSF